MPSPFAWEDDENQDYDSFGSNRPARRSSAMTSFSVPRPISGRTALEDLAAHQSSMPQRQPAKWWQRLAAGALGGAAGYLNAGGRNRVNVEPAIAGIYAGDYPRQMGNWQNEQAGLTTRAKIEAGQADDARRIAEHESTLALRGVQTDVARKGLAREERLASAPAFPKDAQEAIFRIRQSGLPKEQQDAQVQQIVTDHQALSAPKTQGGHWTEDGKGNVNFIPTPVLGQPAPSVVSYPGVGRPAAPPTSKLLTPEEEAQRIRMSATKGPQFSGSAEDIKDTAQAIRDGKATPVISNYSMRDRTALTGELARSGYNVVEAERDYKAVSRHLTTMNGAQQLRLRQAVSFAYDHLDVVDDLYRQWSQKARASGFKIINKAALAASAQLPGETGALAQNLQAQINDFTSEMGTVYKGGNSSTDETLKLAAGNLKADWNEQTWNKAIGLLKTSLTIRRNSIATTEAVGITPGSPYTPTVPEKEPLPGHEGRPAQPAGGTTKTFQQTRTDQNGKKWGWSPGMTEWQLIK